MKNKFTQLAGVVLLICFLAGTASAESFLVPVGKVIGLELQDTGVTVAAVEENKKQTAGGLQAGDRILTVNRIPVKSAQDVKNALENSGNSLQLCILRGDTVKNIRISSPEDGKLGIYLKDSITGVGTVTWYDPATRMFGALGHGVSTPEGKSVPMKTGAALSARVISVQKGTPGTPGQLMGAVDSHEPVGELTGNTPQGIFGRAYRDFPGEKLPLGEVSRIHKGAAVILATVQGQQPAEYAVEILKVSPGSSCRNLLIRVTDPVLLEKTGGIVQGMSGSPIIQDGKLIGAVTHVLVNDPTRGYGIFIENMLEAS